MSDEKRVSGGQGNSETPGNNKVHRSAKKSAKVVALRNRFIYMLYRHALLVFMASLASMLVALFFLIFYIRQPVPPQYIPITEEGRYIPLVPLSEKSKTDAEISRFAMLAIKKIYQYDYMNYSDQIQEAANFFTPKGWEDYLESFGGSRILQAVKENGWISSVRLSTAPIIRDQGLRDGVYSWAVETDITVSYVGKNQGRAINFRVKMLINRLSVIDNPAGVGINKIIFEEREN